ncbi:hypothetical protein RND81_10G139900 [Saponaria officinalis]|uniref:Uncharacterized protein n=1 Tax=Saponaria officinalis TaxID=3572 RepID=A0AAW1I260_SAPOF
MFQAPCPNNSFQYNNTLCHCTPGYIHNTSTNSCTFYKVSPLEWLTSSVVKHSNVDNNYKKAVKFEVFYVEISAIALLCWLMLCVIARFLKLRDGRNAGFQIRWWISRLDLTFPTKHWLADQAIVKKRKTELGGAFSIACWILFIGLLAALLHQIITARATEISNIRATNAPDLESFTNDLDVNVTTISTMSCAQLRGLRTIAIGTPGFVDYTTLPLSTFAEYSCRNSSNGPVITLKRQNCPLTYNHVYISWHFVDIENRVPATAVGFHFNITAKNRVGLQNYTNFISGVLKNGSKSEDTHITYRGTSTNLLKFNLFPRVHRNLHGLKLLQPLFHGFRPGSRAHNVDDLKSLLQSSEKGVVNITLELKFLSEYFIEIDDKKYAGPVSILADLGGLYCLSFTLFLLLLSLCEARFKRLRNEDQVMQNIKKSLKAQDRWDKLRKFVAYTYGCHLLNEEYSANMTTCCFRGNGSIKVVEEHDIQLRSFNDMRRP